MRRIGVAMWIVAAVAVIAEPFLSVRSGSWLELPLNMANGLLYPANLAAFGAIFYLLGEITDPRPSFRFAARNWAKAVWTTTAIAAFSISTGLASMNSRAPAELPPMLQVIAWLLGGLVASGAAIWILGDIRDRTVTPE